MNNSNKIILKENKKNETFLLKETFENGPEKFIIIWSNGSEKRVMKNYNKFTLQTNVRGYIKDLEYNNADALIFANGTKELTALSIFDFINDDDSFDSLLDLLDFIIENFNLLKKISINEMEGYVGEFIALKHIKNIDKNYDISFRNYKYSKYDLFTDDLNFEVKTTIKRNNNSFWLHGEQGKDENVVFLCINTEIVENNGQTLYELYKDVANYISENNFIHKLMEEQELIDSKIKFKTNGYTIKTYKMSDLNVFDEMISNKYVEDFDVLYNFSGENELSLEKLVLKNKL